MREFKSVDLQRDLTAVYHAAAKAPVAITKHSKPRFVLMAIEDYDRLASRPGDPRRVLRTSQTPRDVAEALIEGIEAQRSLRGPLDAD